MTQPYISKPDPVEAAGGIGAYSKEAVLEKNNLGRGIFPYRTIDSFVSEGQITPEIEEQIPSYNPMPLEKATDYFRGCYIAKMAEYTGKTSISDLANKVLDFDRAELSRLVNSYGIGDVPLKDYLTELQENQPDARARYERDVASSIFDPIVRRVFREAISEGYFGLKENTDRFKDIYVNSMAKEMGIRYAADVLDVSERTVRNRIENYKADPRNLLKFPDDCKPESIDDLAEAGNRSASSTARQAEEEAELWAQQKAAERSSD